MKMNKIQEDILQRPWQEANNGNAYIRAETWSSDGIFFADHTVACQIDPFRCGRQLAFRLRNRVSDLLYPLPQ